MNSPLPRQSWEPALDVTVLWTINPAAHRGYRILVTLSLALAAVIAGGGDERMSAAAFATQRAIGGPLVWAVLFAACAGALGIARLMSSRWMRFTLLGCAVIYMLWAIGFLVTALASPTSPFTGPVAYAFIAAWHVSQSEIYRRVKPVQPVAGDDTPAGGM